MRACQIYDGSVTTPTSGCQAWCQAPHPPHIRVPGGCPREDRDRSSQGLTFSAVDTSGALTRRHSEPVDQRVTRSMFVWQRTFLGGFGWAVSGRDPPGLDRAVGTNCNRLRLAQRASAKGTSGALSGTSPLPIRVSEARPPIDRLPGAVRPPLGAREGYESSRRNAGTSRTSAGTSNALPAAAGSRSRSSCGRCSGVRSRRSLR